MQHKEYNLFVSDLALHPRFYTPRVHYLLASKQHEHEQHYTNNRKRVKLRQDDNTTKTVFWLRDASGNTYLLTYFIMTSNWSKLTETARVDSYNGFTLYPVGILKMCHDLFILLIIRARIAITIARCWLVVT